MGPFFIEKLEMSKKLNCYIGLINTDSLVIFKFRNSKFDLKDSFGNN